MLINPKEITPLENSLVQRIVFKDLEFYLKRDDLLHPFLNGNKVRKFYYLLKTPLNIKKVISYGSMQSNAMSALAYLAKIRGLEFEYYCKINKNLLHSPKGNLKFALNLGMRLKDINEFDYVKEDINLFSRLLYVEDKLIIPEGGRFKEAQEGIRKLAFEILSWAKVKSIKPDIFLPSGTGTTALFLQKYLPFRVYTTPCVGDKEYLKKQFFSLEANEKFHPIILDPPKKFTFAKPDKRLWQIYQELKKTGVEFELIYDTVAFLTILEHKKIFKNLFYIHQGGIRANETMVQRYKAKFGKICN
jgi:1-aminocyclopropane-1-carboxylate deaminase/D-cysteine desulfhydrase-like pyridoxal-dependent ACC family enzyme